MTNKQETSLRNAFLLADDRAEENPSRDLFGRASFARQLAKRIATLDSSRGLVIGLYGSWGSGKTTTLNFIKHYLNEDPERVPPQIIEFNPWWFASTENLAKAFLGQLRAALPSRVEQAKELGDLIGNLSDGIGHVAGLIGIPGVGPMAKLLKRKPQDVPAIKAKIAEHLSKLKRRFVIVIDDIDRLDAQEARELFKVIKGLADFPNVVYLVAFDREMTELALTSSGIEGDAYLEKIIQVPFELPPVDRLDLQNMFVARLNEVIGELDDGEFDQQHWSRVLTEGIAPLLRVPRDVIRLANSLGVTLPAVRHEVNVVDFVAIDIIRVLMPSVYSSVRDNVDRFAGLSSANANQATKDEEKKFHERWLAGLDEQTHRPIAKSLIEILFPRLSAVWGNSHYSERALLDWRRERRLCSPDIFPIYFRLSLPRGAVSGVEVQSLVESARDPKAFSSALLAAVNVKRHDGTTKADALLERFFDHVRDDLAEDALEPVIRTLLDIGDELLGEVPSGIFSLGAVSVIARIVYQCAKRLNDDRRGDVLILSVTKGRSYSVAEFLVLGYEKEQSKQVAGASESDLNDATVSELRQAIVLKAKQAAESGTLLENKFASMMINRWIQWGQPGECISWLMSEVIPSDKSLLQFLANCVSKVYHSSANGKSGESERLQLRWLAPDLNLSLLQVRVDEIEKRYEMNKREVTIVGLFRTAMGEASAAD